MEDGVASGATLSADVGREQLLSEVHELTEYLSWRELDELPPFHLTDEVKKG